MLSLPIIPEGLFIYLEKQFEKNYSNPQKTVGYLEIYKNAFEIKNNNNNLLVNLSR